MSQYLCEWNLLSRSQYQLVVIIPIKYVKYDRDCRMRTFPESQYKFSSKLALAMASSEFHLILLRVIGVMSGNFPVFNENGS